MFSNTLEIYLSNEVTQHVCRCTWSNTTTNFSMFHSSLLCYISWFFVLLFSAKSQLHSFDKITNSTQVMYLQVKHKAKIYEAFLERHKQINHKLSWNSQLVLQDVFFFIFESSKTLVLPGKYIFFNSCTLRIAIMWKLNTLGLHRDWNSP